MMAGNGAEADVRDPLHIEGLIDPSLLPNLCILLVIGRGDAVLQDLHVQRLLKPADCRQSWIRLPRSASATWQTA